METVLKKSVVSVGMLFPSVTPAQETPALDYLNILDLKEEILINWQIAQGSICNGIKIYRSTNHRDFVQVGEIDGVCGHSSRPVRYVFKDENPIRNQVSNYRLDLGGGNTKTTPIAIEVKTTGFDVKNYQIKPTPVISTSQLVFNNERNKEAIIYIFGIKGKHFPPLTTNANVMDINTENYNPDLYFFNIIIENELITSGKFIVQ